MEIRTMPCDWCGKETECSQLQNTHYWICLNCAIVNIGCPTNIEEKFDKLEEAQDE